MEASPGQHHNLRGAVVPLQVHVSSQVLLVLQVASLFVWFSTVAAFYALYLPVLPNAVWQATAAVLYTVATGAVFCTYFLTR